MKISHYIRYVFIGIVCNSSFLGRSENNEFVDNSEQYKVPNSNANKKINSDEVVTSPSSSSSSSSLRLPSDIMSFKLGCPTDKDPITIYMLPSCMHCTEFIAVELHKFLEKYGQMYGVKIRFIIFSPKDLFIIKLFAKKFPKNNIEMFWKIIDYMKRLTATINQFDKIENEMEKYKLIAEQFGFTKKEIEEAIPDPDGEIEQGMMEVYRQHAKQIREVNGGNEVDLPFMTKSSKKIEKLPEED
ncbi:MAG: DsbA family protein [Holosporales bacterium]|jgi:hypothetical protein|nr:DsbA family protein [Holosporales bacterium]